MNASEALLRGIAWRLAFLVLLVFVAQNVPDNRPQMVADAQATIVVGSH